MFRGPFLKPLTGAVLTLGAFTVYTGSKLGPISVTQLNSTVMVDRMPGSDATAQVAACVSQLPSSGGICDARGYGASAQTISSGTMAVGAVGKPVILLWSSLTPLTCNLTGGSSTDCTQVFEGSAIIATGVGQAIGGGGAAWHVGASANVRSLISNGTKTGQNTMTIRGLMLQNDGGTVAKGLIYINGANVNSSIQDTNTQGCRGTCLYVEGSSGPGGAGTSDFTFINDNFDASHTGSSPVVVLQGPGVDGLTFHGGAMQHASDGQNILYADQVGGAGFYGVHFETYGSAPGNAGDAIAISDSSNLIFSGVKTSGASGTNFFSISHGSHTTPKNIIITGLENPGAWTNLVNNSVSGAACSSNSLLCGSQSLVAYYYNGGVVNDGITTTGLSSQMIWTAYVPGAFSTNSSYAIFTPDLSITVESIEVTWIVNAGTCTGAPTITLENAGPTNAITWTWDGSVHQIASFSQNYAAGSQIVMLTNAGTCATEPNAAHIYVHYKLQ